MKISNSKKELARIISENGGWREMAKFSAQDKDGDVYHFSTKPTINAGHEAWHHKGCIGEGEFTAETLPNWHQTILSREEYFHLYPAPDSDGWIEWKGGAANPVEFGVLVDVKLANGEVLNRVSANSGAEWRHCWGDANIIAYRLHNPEQDKPRFCESVMGSIPGPIAKQTIKQLAAYYRNAKDFAERKQQEADDAKAVADAALGELERAGEALGLLVSPITEKQEPELVITNRSQLELGDVIWLSDSTVKENNELTPSGEYTVVKVGVIGVESDGQTIYPDFSTREWRFIRRQ